MVTRSVETLGSKKRPSSWKNALEKCRIVQAAPDVPVLPVWEQAAKPRWLYPTEEKHVLYGQSPGPGFLLTRALV